MTVKEVQAILGPDEVEDGHLRHESKEWMGDVEVQFDGEGRAIWISGGHLELNGLDLKPKMSPEGSEIRCPQFDSLLKEADWKEGQRGDFTHEWYYPKYNLILQRGCGGWSFFLRQE